MIHTFFHTLDRYSTLSHDATFFGRTAYYSLHAIGFGSISLISSGLLSFATGITAFQGMTFFVVAYAVFKLTENFFIDCFTSCHKNVNQSFIFIATKCCTALIASALVCTLIGINIGIGQILLLTGAFCVVYCLASIALYRLGQYLSYQSNLKT